MKILMKLLMENCDPFFSRTRREGPMKRSLFPSVSDRSRSLSRKRVQAQEIHQKFVETLTRNIVVYSLITWYFWKATFASQNREASVEAKCRNTNGCDAGIANALIENPFPSVCQSSKLTCVSRSAVHRCLPKLLEFTIHYLPGISHHLSNDHEGIRAKSFRERPLVLQAEQALGSDDIVTLNEFSFYFLMEHEQI